MMGKLSGINAPLQLVPEYRDYVWGGDRLRPGMSPTAEAWVVYENNLIATGEFAGSTLIELVKIFGPDLLGQRPFQQTGSRFPLLIKLLDCAQWLSLQVHPNDEQAEHLEGKGFFGKTEAWHIIEAASDAKIIAGIQPGTTRGTLTTSIQNGTILNISQSLPINSGDTVFIQPGTLHALGPGLLLYEVQQTSNLTYRVYDWGRPQTGGRALHIEKSIQVVDPTRQPVPSPMPLLRDGDCQVLCQSQYFTLEIISSEKRTISQDTRMETFHALTVISGSVRVDTAAGSIQLNQFDTALLPAGCQQYQLAPLPNFRILKSSVP